MYDKVLDGAKTRGLTLGPTISSSSFLIAFLIFFRAVVSNANDDIRHEVPEHVIFDNYGDYYDMTGDKHMIILNQHEFKSTVYFK